MLESENIAIAIEYFDKGYKMHLDGKLESAIKEYKNSIQIFPTAKAYTFLGWAYSLQGNFELAIDECKKAIELEPDFDSAYRDIGINLMNLNKLDEALFWLERAANFSQSHSKYLSLFNIGKIYDKMNDWLKASKYYNQALLLKPDYEPAQIALIRISTLFN